MMRTKVILIAGAIALLASSCKEHYTTYDDAEYVMFADTAKVYAVQQDVEFDEFRLLESDNMVVE